MDEGFDERGFGVGRPETDGAVLMANMYNCVPRILGHGCWSSGLGGNLGNELAGGCVCVFEVTAHLLYCVLEVKLSGAYEREKILTVEARRK